mmetsp:Transcript_52837/g.120443  ORF Transcript_52837/g.120443 Transcript_52837/m.120443 type:complete len:84 (+) Transcript_52837:2432-2683(+)
MRAAERRAAREGWTKVAVISGVGVRNFYRRLGYELEPGAGEFMVKRLSPGFRLRHHRHTPWLLTLFALLLAVAAAQVLGPSKV